MDTVIREETLKNYDESLGKLEELIKRTRKMRGKDISNEQADTIIYEANILIFDIEKERELFKKAAGPATSDRSNRT